MEILLLTLALGTAIGLALALTGAGGGILAVPLLVFGLHLSVREAAPVALLAVGLAAVLGASLAFRENRLRYRAAALIGGIGIAAAPGGVWIAHQLPVAALTGVFALVLAYVAVRMIRDARRTAGPDEPLAPVEKLPCVINPEEGRLRWTAPCVRALTFTGLLSGVLSGALGVGGGFVIVPALARYSDLDQRSVVGTSLGVIALVSAGSVAIAALSGTLRWEVALPFAGGAALGILLGRGIAPKLSGPVLRQLFGIVSLGAAASMLYRALGV